PRRANTPFVCKFPAKLPAMATGRITMPMSWRRRPSLYNIAGFILQLRLPIVPHSTGPWQGGTSLVKGAEQKPLRRHRAAAARVGTVVADFPSVLDIGHRGSTKSNLGETDYGLDKIPTPGCSRLD